MGALKEEVSLEADSEEEEECEAEASVAKAESKEHGTKRRPSRFGKTQSSMKGFLACNSCNCTQSFLVGSCLPQSPSCCSMH